MLEQIPLVFGKLSANSASRSSLPWLTPVLRTFHSLVPLGSRCPLGPRYRQLTSMRWHPRDSVAFRSMILIRRLLLSTGLAWDALRQARVRLSVSICVFVPCVIVFEGVGIVHTIIRHQRKSTAGQNKAIAPDRLSYLDTAIKARRQTNAGAVQLLQ